jgi:hypothetical protein
VDAYIYHYGWVKHPAQQMQKISAFQQLWTAEGIPMGQIPKTAEKDFDYSEIDSLERFSGTHPSVMNERIRRKNWQFDFDVTRKNFSLKNKLLYWIEQKTGKRLFEYRNYKII